MNFQRGKSPAAALELGGYTFDTIRVGAILESVRWFGVARSTGNLRGYSSSAIQFCPPNILEIIKITSGDGKRKILSFQKYRDEKRRLEITHGSRRIDGFIDISKTQFDYRLKIIGYVEHPSQQL